MVRMLIALFAFGCTSAFAQQEIPFDGVNPLKLPKNLYLGEVTGVAVNAKGHIFVLSRGNTTGPAYAAAAAQLLEFDANGKFIREIGKNLYAWSFGHTVRIDKEQNIWVADKGSDMVVRFNPKGDVTLVFGRKQEASDKETGPLEHPNPPLPAEEGKFRQVTDMAWDPAGNVYISDGYVNSRVAKADKNGNWLKSWGVKGNKPGELNTPHSIAADAPVLTVRYAITSHEAAPFHFLFKQHLPVLTKFRTFRQALLRAWASFAPMLRQAFWRRRAS